MHVTFYLGANVIMKTNESVGTQAGLINNNNNATNNADGLHMDPIFKDDRSDLFDEQSEPMFEPTPPSTKRRREIKVEVVSPPPETSQNIMQFPEGQEIFEYMRNNPQKLKFDGNWKVMGRNNMPIKSSDISNIIRYFFMVVILHRLVILI